MIGDSLRRARRKALAEAVQRLGVREGELAFSNGYIVWVRTGKKIPNSPHLPKTDRDRQGYDRERKESPVQTSRTRSRYDW